MKDLSLKDRSGVAWDLLLFVSIIGIAIACWMIAMQPKPSRTVSKTAEKSLRQTMQAAEKTEQVSAESLKKLKDRTWPVNAEVLGSQLLDKLTAIAEKNHSKVERFSMGSTVTAANLKEARFNVTVQGAFMDVMAVVKALEDPDSKVVLNDLKIASATGSDQVSGSLALTGFLYSEGN